MCDTQSAPEYRHTCEPNSDANARFRSADPGSPDYIGKAPGNAYMEVQFYEPGWVGQFDGFGCTPKHWCANMTIDSLEYDQNTGELNNEACDQLTLGGEEPVNWAYITKSGKPQAPANPIDTNNNPAALVPDPKQVLFMESGDVIRVHMHDTPAGYRVDMKDLTTGGHGSMTASKANGFGHLLFQPDSKTCNMEPYAFHPMYSSATSRGNTWSAHSYNVAFSDEIGHFEACNAVDFNGGDCTSPGWEERGGLDEDDSYCLDGSQYPDAVPIIGCLLDDGDFDGSSYKPDWPGATDDRQDGGSVPTPVLFTPAESGGRPLERVAFETDLPRIEVGEPANPYPPCDRLTGEHCLIPPPNAEFYPIYTLARTGMGCVFQQGGTNIPQTVNRFGGTPQSEYGSLYPQVYPEPGWTTLTLFNDFRRDLGTNPCAGG
jgi:hypothetical protein